MIVNVSALKYVLHQKLCILPYNYIFYAAIHIDLIILIKY